MSATITATAAALDVAAIRAQFPVLARQVHGHPLVYLDNAATTLKPQAVIDRLHQHYAAETANIHRGVHYLSEQATIAYEQVRQRMQVFLGASQPEEIIFTSGTTDSINLVAQGWGGANLGPGDEVVITYLEHHSNIVPWQMLAERTGAVLRVVPISDRGELEWQVFLDMLGHAPSWWRRRTCPTRWAPSIRPPRSCAPPMRWGRGYCWTAPRRWPTCRWT